VAVGLVREAQESVRVVREKDWTLFTGFSSGDSSAPGYVPKPYHPAISDNTWILTNLPFGSETINGMTRQVVINDVCRDINGIIASTCTGNTPDPSTKKVVITVGWGAPTATSINITEYLTRSTNQSYVETTSAQFSSGTYGPSIAITNTSSGEITLGAGGNADWCKPDQFIVAQFNLHHAGATDAITAIPGQVLIGGNIEKNVSFSKLNITDTDPPVVSQDGTFGGYNTKGVFGDKNYGYLATDNDAKEVVIIDLNSKDAKGNYKEVGSFNTPGNAAGKQVWVLGNVGYVLSNKHLYSFELSSKTGSRPILDPDGVALGGDGTRIVMAGNYAYITVNGSSQELKIIDVHDPINMTVIGGLDLQAVGQHDKDGRDIAIDGLGRAYIITGKNKDTTIPDFFVVNVSNPSAPIKIASYVVSVTDPKALTVVEAGKRAIIIGNGGQEYQVFTISSAGVPSYCGGLNVDVKDNGIASVLEPDSDAFSYIMTNDASNEFKAIKGGPGGAYALLGVFTSQTLDTNHDVAFNNFSATTSTPANTSISFKIAIKHRGASGTCSGVAFSDSDFVLFSPGPLTLGTIGAGYANPGQCLKYQAILTSDASNTPILYDISFNYSP
jgi:hypothetical protein